MGDDHVVESIKLYREALKATSELYGQAGQQIRDSYGHMSATDAAAAADQMQDLHQGLVMKVYSHLVPNGDPNLEQRQLGRVLLGHLWDKPVMGGDLRDAIHWLTTAAAPFDWENLVHPFLEIPALRNRYAELTSLVMRMANLIARVDGQSDRVDTARLRNLQQTLDDLAQRSDRVRTLPPADLVVGPAVESPVEARQPPSSSSPPDHPGYAPSTRAALQWLRDEARRLATAADDSVEPATGRSRETPTETSPHPSERAQEPRVASRGTPTVPADADEPHDPRTAEQRLADARGKLDQLIGLENIKHQIETLTNFLKMEKLRAAEGLPTTRPSLHMAFVGNPGTGKTTVARIIAEIYGALGILEKGHLVETDRSGLVAEYAGQTGPKTNTKVDEALDGVLFIDEAYTLIDTSGQDQYGREAVQTLLKRMEDQRERLVVILAGYPVEMEMMIRSNPGLSSRVGTTLQFEDYSPGELARIFGLMADKAEYAMPTESRRRILHGFDYLYDRRDRHFGNGRTVRNSFERSVRRLANRLATLAEIDRQVLTTLQSEDIEIAGIDAAHLAALAAKTGHVRVRCSQCHKETTVDDQQLAQSLDCPGCGESFIPAWGDPVLVADPVTTDASKSDTATAAESAQSSEPASDESEGRDRSS